jgi:crotonobetaine/carnitine-CoA ligase
MSETPYGTVWRRGTRPYGTLGSPRQHPTLGEVNEARVNADGELELRNPAVMKGYWRMPEETAAVLAPDGWLKTGDLVTANPDGTYTMIGRKKEVIRRRGENVAPAEIEEALASHPDVVEAAVVGVPSELSEEDIKAFVVLREGAEPDVGELREWVSRLLTPFKVPSTYEVLDELPHTATGRVAKHRLPT